jgi:hypothetical protein
VITVGSSTSLAELLSLPLKNGLTERGDDGKERALPREKFYVPGSVLSASVDNTHPLGYGLASTVDVFYENSPAFRLNPDANAKGLKPVVWFTGPSVLRSGWAWGQPYLDGTVTVVEATIGEGKLFLMGPDVTYRGQPHGTFKLLFNGIYYGGATSVVIGRAGAAKTGVE